jgi:hypothetical protein
MTKYATTLMYSIRRMASSQDKQVLIQATEATLRTIWLALSVGSFGLFLLSCIVAITTMRRNAKIEETDLEQSAETAPKLVLETDLEPDFLWLQDGKLKVFLDIAVNSSSLGRDRNSRHEEMPTDKEFG